MKFLSFVIMMVILEVLFLFYFKQTSSMVAMSVINIGALCCFFSKNWRNTQKTYKSLVISAFIIGNIFTLVRELLEGYEFSEIVYFAIIISAGINFLFTSAIAFPHLSGAPNSNFNSSNQFSNFDPQNLEDDSTVMHYQTFDDDSFSSRIETNPATGLLSCGGIDSAGNMYGTSSHDFSSFDDSYSSYSSFDHDDYSRRDS